MKIVLLFSALIMGINISTSAQKHITRSGRVSFNATSAKSSEKIEAINNEAAAAINTSTSDVVFQVPIKSFKFENALMQEHFNENYMESDKFPKADFKGKYSSTQALTKDGTYNATVNGNLTIHGVSKEVQIPGIIIIKGTEITLNATFTVKLADYKVAIPNVVSDKVGKESVIKINCILKKA
ncbi:MAG: YceI family protein [Phycisphaerales bacterium]|nr:YceI family protein [Phycisphaerales bacterium]